MSDSILTLFYRFVSLDNPYDWCFITSDNPSDLIDTPEGWTRSDGNGGGIVQESTEVDGLKAPRRK